MVNGPTHGTLTLNANGSFTYTPNADFNGSDSFTYRANDGAANSAPVPVTISINPDNDPPVAQNDAYSLNEDTTLNLPAPGVLSNDTDVDGDALTAERISGPSHGILTLNADGSFSYTPNANYNGTDTFTYRARDAAANSGSATVTLTIHPDNDAPVAQNDSYSLNEDATLNITAPGVLSNDTDVDGDALTAERISGPSHGTLILRLDGSFSYTPDANYHGLDTFTYHARDAAANSVAATVTLTINPDNDAPVAQNDSYSLNEDATLNITAPGVLSNDTDVDGDALTAERISGPSHGTLILRLDGSFSYTPDANYHGLDTFTYHARDAAANSGAATVTLTVNPLNDPPVAQNDAYSLNEDATLNIAAPGVLSNDTDVDGDPLTALRVGGPSHGTLTLRPDGSFTYVPDANYHGTDTFSYQANDGMTNSGLATVTLTISADNDAPVAQNDAYSLNEDTTLNIAIPGVLSNDTDVDGDSLTAERIGGPSHGTLTLRPDGSFTYTPDANYHGTDTFTYRAKDASANSGSATVTLTIKSVNDAPVGVADSYSMNEDGTLNITVPGVLGNDTDVDGDSLTSVPVTGVSHGQLLLNPDGSFTYTPNADYHGTDSFLYLASDGTASSPPILVTITVKAVNDAPVAVADSYSMNEDGTLNITVPGVLGNDSDVDGDALTAVLVTGVSHGQLTLHPDGSFTYTPNADYHGTDSFTYKANDGTANSTPVTVTITVKAVNDAPVAVADNYSMNEDGTLNITVPGVLGNDTDVDGDALTAVLVTGVSHGHLTLNPNGSFTYTPNANYNGTDSFTYQANDGTANSTSVTVTITVNAVNDAPVAVADSYSMNEDGTLNITVPGVLGNDTDVDGDALTAVLVTGVSHGQLTLNPNGSFTYVPNTDYNGTDSFTYKANDGTANSTPVTVTITVNAVNDAPVAVADNYSMNEDGTLNITVPGVLGNDTDVDGDALTAVLVTGVSHGQLTLNPNGSFTYTPNADYNGTDSFTYKANDGTADSMPVTVTITVGSVNDVPVAQNDTYSTDEDVRLYVPLPGVLANDSDVDGDTLTAEVLSLPAHGNLVLYTNGAVFYRPDADYHGKDSFTYRAVDSATNSASAMVIINVLPVNDAPVGMPDNYSIDEDGTLNLAGPGVLGNDTDVDGDALTAVLVGNPAHGTLTLNPDGSFSYTPNANYHGTDSFTYVAYDGTVSSDPVTVTITVNSVNDAPVAVADNYSVNEDSSLNIPAPGVLGNDTDLDGDVLTAVLGTGPRHGQLTLNPNGSFTYTPDPDYNGTDSFTYQANDGTISSGSVTVTINVNAVNDAPVARNDAYSMNEDTTLNIAAPGVLGNDTDVDGDPLAAMLVGHPSHGTLALNPNGSFGYVPSANYHGQDSFTYRANDGILNSGTATVAITVNSVNDNPNAPDVVLLALENTTNCWNEAEFRVGATDGDGDTLAVVAVSPTSTLGGLVELAGTSVSYFPPPRPADTNEYWDSFSVMISDGEGGAVTITAMVNVIMLATEKGDVHLEQQVGVYSQVVRVTNPLPPQDCGTATAIHLRIDGMPSDASVFNASGQTNGTWYVQYNQPLAPGQSIDLVVEYHLLNRNNLPSPVFTAIVERIEPQVPEDGIPHRIDRIVRLQDGRIMIEFTSIAGRSYSLQYSTDLKEWKHVTPTLEATANRTQWIDNGPPKTESDPAQTSRRFYRLAILP